MTSVFMYLATDTFSTAIPVPVPGRLVTRVCCMACRFMFNVAFCSLVASAFCRSLLWGQAAQPTCPTKAVSSQNTSQEAQVHNKLPKEMYMYVFVAYSYVGFDIIDCRCWVNVIAARNCPCCDDCCARRYYGITGTGQDTAGTSRKRGRADLGSPQPLPPHIQYQESEKVHPANSCMLSSHM